MRPRRLYPLLALAISLGPLFAEGGIRESTSLSLVAATTLEAKVSLLETVTFPLLAGASPLTEGNNLRLEFGAELSPVSVNGTFLAALTPAAFLELSTGAGVGTGWNIPVADGLRMNLPGQGLKDDSFGGAVWYWKGGGTLRFDLAAILPGEWNHVLLQTYQGARYRAYTGASGDESWLWEADAGENMNGWAYYGSYFAGYAFPQLIDVAGFLVENDTRLYGTKGGDYWGESQPTWTFGPLVSVAFGRGREGTPRSTLTALVQWQALRHFTDSTWENDFYQDREVDTDDPWRREFYRAALIYRLNLR